ncbi:MAG TPA: hypothetical protein VD973_29010 [Symbiobacteriaceae bacterium]|nr:hypothetical protein [Symbiobacteriaceae bacterium]
MGGFVRMFNPNLMIAAEAGRMFRTMNPFLTQAIVEAARTQMRTQRFVELVREAMRRTGRVQVELNPCDIWNAEELMAAMRMARQPLSLQLGGRSYQANLRNVRARCPGTMAEWDYDLIWVLGAERSMFRGSVTMLGQQVLVASLDPMERPIHASICYRNFEILRLDVPQQVTSRFGPEYFGRVRDGLIREASALPLCISMLRLPMIGIG